MSKLTKKINPETIVGVVSMLFRIFISLDITKLAFTVAKPKIIRDLADNPLYAKSKRIAEELYEMVRAMFYSMLRVKWGKKSLNVFIRAIFLNPHLAKANEEWKRKFGHGPPGFLVISPTKLCNLRCPGCYANSAGERDKLPYKVFQRIVKEARELWGNRFCVLSGGEPLMYRSDGKTVLDLVGEFPDSIFLMFTNGLLIDETIAKRIRELGNLTPAISVEGMKKTTDSRRGAGTFDNILRVMQILRQEHVIFGISLTATKENCEEILSEEFIDFFFNKMGVAYGWIFHYMPIGRDVDVNLMPTPAQRVWMWKRSWEIIKSKKIFLVDFWNHGTTSSGCLAGGRQGGYLHINWHGDVAPCVFLPYATSNIQEVYKSGGNLNDVIMTPFFKAIRQWQVSRGFPQPARLAQELQNYSVNWLRPCPIRDHFQEAFKIIKEHQARPLDYAPDCIYLEQKSYFDAMSKYDEELKTLTDPIWHKTYQHNR
ncbi:MAG: radical SAM protein [candidate division WOR-3 bacterium]